MRILAACLVATLCACSSLPPRTEVPVETAVPVGDGPIDRAVSPAEAAHPGQSAFRLVVDGEEAFALRIHGARQAARSLDVQTYIWHADLTGLVMAHAVLEAADRGVRVRLLLDDMDARGKNAALAALSAHPRIAIRIFNPFASRSGTARMLGEFLGDFDRVNHRMHNKSWIIDNRVALVGGRNIGDEYFAASDEKNFVDLDYAMIGPVVREASASFDRYWNSAAAYPMDQLDPGAVTAGALARLRETLAASAREADASRYAKALRENESLRRLAQGDIAISWSPRWRFVADDPGKPTMKEGDPARSQVAGTLLPLARDVGSHLTIISPYFVPGAATDDLAGLARKGVKVRILTNSLVANDVAAVHGGYSRHRPALVEGGVQLWELKPLPGEKTRSSLTGSSGASLHTKALAIDAKQAFVGSYNLDPRSTWLNTEQGILVEDEAIARQLEAIFAQQTSGERAWRVKSADGRLQWSDGTETLDREPRASLWRRFQAGFARFFHLDEQL